MPVVFQIAVISVNFFISIIIQRRASFATIIDKYCSYCLTYNHNGYFFNNYHHDADNIPTIQEKQSGIQQEISPQIPIFL